MVRCQLACFQSSSRTSDHVTNGKEVMAIFAGLLSRCRDAAIARPQRSSFLIPVALGVGALVFGLLASRRATEAEKGGALCGRSSDVDYCRIPWPSLLQWCVVSVGGSSSALTNAIIGDYFAAELIAVANGALNVLQFD